ncbi:MAG: DUF2497 domain-containing protein [Blastochloris viridis]|uniref:DUF2497 domain-containing protein n=1 Tax=Blastochloris viridis TaxID=1079 RepID=A0A6N4RED9_BLAVI|nr:MAG: DUF2497 domain-containing protein [Blastochloris viridis]
MANDTSSNLNANPVQTDMDDILSSIRSGVAEEGVKVGTGSADLIDAAAAAEGDIEDDVLELSEMDMVTVAENAGEAEELIDLEAFGASGEAKSVVSSDIGGVAGELLQSEVADPVVADAADEFDRLLAEISQEQQQVAGPKISKEDLMAEDAPLGAEESIVAETDAEEVSVVEGVQVASAPVAATVDVQQVTSAAASRFEVGAIQGPEGVQVAFPAEVLAMALRPMVQDWLAKNLPDVVEKLVKEEISKLAQS